MSGLGFRGLSSDFLRLSGLCQKLRINVGYVRLWRVVTQSLASSKPVGASPRKAFEEFEKAMMHGRILSRMAELAPQTT